MPSLFLVKSLKAGPTNITDNFNRSGTLFGSTTTTGGAVWTQGSTDAGNSNYSTNGSVAVGDGNHNAPQIVNAGSADGTVQITIVEKVGSDAGLVLRYDPSTGNFIFLTSNNQFYLYTKSTNSFSSLGTLGGAFVNGDVMKAVMSGTSITVYKNGTQVASYTTAFNQANTYHGFGGYAAGISFDDFSVS